MRHVTLPGGETVPALGQGTWYMGDNRGSRKAEADALRLGIDLGMTLIDTAEMYANGGAEEVVADAARVGARTVWLQLGIWNEDAARQAEAAGLEIVMDRCVKIEHARFHGGLNLAGFVTGVISSRRQELDR